MTTCVRRKSKDAYGMAIPNRNDRGRSMDLDLVFYILCNGIYYLRRESALLTRRGTLGESETVPTGIMVTYMQYSFFRGVLAFSAFSPSSPMPPRTVCTQASLRACVAAKRGRSIGSFTTLKYLFWQQYPATHHHHLGPVEAT